MKFSEIKLNQIIDLLIILLPIAYILGSPFVNLILILGSLIFIFRVVKDKNFNWLKLLWVKIFILFWLYLIISSFLATDIFNSFRASFSFIRFLLFSLLISFYGFNSISILRILNFWKFILLIVLLDIFVQYLFDYNTIGLFKHGVRYSGFFGNELIAGSYIFKITSTIIGILFFNIFYFSKNKKLFYYSCLFSIFCFFICLITGERMNFLLLFTLYFIFIFWILSYQQKHKQLLLICVSSFLIITSVAFYSESIKSRYFDMANIIKNFDQSSYGKLFNSGYRLWIKNPVFGVGVKNFRIECDEQLVDILTKNPSQLCSSHPHNLYLEVLTDTGFFGLILFISLFLSYYRSVINFDLFKLKNKKDFILFGCVFSSILMIWPIGTSGSFFTTWNGSYLWIQIGIINYLHKVKYL